MKVQMKVTVLLTGLALSMATHAAPMIDYHDGSVGHLYDLWTSGEKDSFSQPVNPGIDAGVGGAGVLIGGRQAIEITGDTPDDNVYVLQLQTTAFDTNMKDYDSQLVTGLQFDFYSGSGAPSQIGFFLQSNVGDGSVWYYDISTVHPSGWQNYSVAFSDTSWYGYENANWDDPLTFSNLDAALGNVFALGMYVYFNPSELDQQYAIENYGVMGAALLIPEPETYVALGMALLGMAFVFRKRISDSLAEAKDMIQA